jgi:hypothetical protein
MLQITNHPLYGKHDIDSVMNSFWSFYKSRFLTLFITSFVMSLVVQYGSTFIDLKELQTLTGDPMAMLEKLKEYIFPMIIIGLVGLFFSNILHYYILFKPLDSTKNIFTSVIASLKYFIPYLIILIILAFFGTFAIVLGLMALIVGVFFSFLYLMMISIFILPVMMTEGINIGNTIVRVAKLSHRNFWNNIGWAAVFLLLLIIVSLILSGVTMLPFTGSFVKSITNPEDAGKVLEMTSSPLFIILSALVNALTMPVIPIFGFLLYFNGRAREVTVEAPVYGDDNYKVRVEDLYAKPLPEEKPEDDKKEELKG